MMSPGRLSLLPPRRKQPLDLADDIGEAQRQRDGDDQRREHLWNDIQAACLEDRVTEPFRGRHELADDRADQREQNGFDEHRDHHGAGPEAERAQRRDLAGARGDRAVHRVDRAEDRAEHLARQAAEVGDRDHVEVREPPRDRGPDPGSSSGDESDLVTLCHLPSSRTVSRSSTV